MSAVMYVLGKISDQSYLRYEKFNSEQTKVPTAEDVKNNNAKVLGIDATDIYVYTSTDTTDINRVINNDEFTLNWLNSEITGLDFSSEDSKRLIVLKGVDPDDTSTMKLEIIANNTDVSLVQCTAYISYESEEVNEVDTNFNETLLVPFDPPTGRRAFSRLKFVNGYAEKSFKTSTYGVWEIPNKYKFAGQNAKIYPGYEYQINALLDI